MRQLTSWRRWPLHQSFSELPMRQLTRSFHRRTRSLFSELPMRQLTALNYLQPIVRPRDLDKKWSVTKIFDPAVSP